MLIVYLCCDPRGRPLLKETGLTDLDVQTACAFESYGRGEITRRARLRFSQEEDARKQTEKNVKKQKKSAGEGSSSDPLPDVNESDFDDIDHETGLPIEDDTASIVNDDGDDSDDAPDLEAAALADQPINVLDTERADRKVLATKRKRSNKGYATASTADSHGILTW